MYTNIHELKIKLYIFLILLYLRDDEWENGILSDCRTSNQNNFVKYAARERLMLIVNFIWRLIARFSYVLNEF